MTKIKIDNLTVGSLKNLEALLDSKLEDTYAAMSMALKQVGPSMNLSKKAMDDLSKGVETKTFTFSEDTLAELKSITEGKKPNLKYGADYSTYPDQTVIGYGSMADYAAVKVLKSKNVMEGVPAPKLGKPEKSATMQALPKKGPQMITDFKVYRFGAVTEGDASMKDVLGGKGANLAEMAKMELPVPPGFTIPTAFSVEYNNLKSSQFTDDNDSLQPMMESLLEKVKEADAYLFKQFGYAPLVSVRSGARVSMPGMMDTILNVGIGDWNLDEWKARVGEKTALDSYRRFLQMYGSTALGIPDVAFKGALEDLKNNAKVNKDSKLDVTYLVRLIKRYKDIYAVHSKAFPQSREEALQGAIEAVFESWNNDRAKAYRKEENIPEEWGTAVTVQAMVFGNMNDQSCSGVAFTRDKATGVNKAGGDFIVNAQGEDVVAAGAPTQPFDELLEWKPQVYAELLLTMTKLENHFKDMQDVEFTVQDGKLWLLQTRKGKRSALAAFRIAHDMVKEGMIDKAAAMQRLSREQLLTVLRPQIDPDFKGKPIVTGLGVGGTLVSGVACFTSKAAIDCKKEGISAILVREETDPDDFEGIMASVGVLTATGGTTSHAAVVANGFDKTCVVGCTDLVVGPSNAYMDGELVFQSGDVISIDGLTGNVYLGTVNVIEPKLTDEILAVASWFSDEGTAYRITPRDPSECEAALQAVPKDVEVVHVDTCLLDMDCMLWSLGNSINKCHAKTVVLDLSHVDDYYKDIDKASNKMFGWDPLLGAGNKRAMTLKGMNPEAILKCVLKLPSSCTMGDKLRKQGFKVVGPVKTVADLLSADGAVLIDQETITNVFGSKEALQWVQDAMGKAGKAPSKPLPSPTYWYEPLMRKGA